MSKNKEVLEFEGQVVEVLPGSLFRVVLENDHQLLCYLGGKLKQHKIRVILGDRVRVEVSPYDLNKGRVMFRL